MNIVSRKEAINLGLGRYFTGKECKHGHVCERITGSRRCVMCNRAYQSRRLSENHELKEKEIARLNKMRNEIKISGGMVRSRNARNSQKRRSYNKNPVNTILRVMLRRCLHGSDKKHKTEKYFDYTTDQLRCHIESLFEHGMTWDNYGEWHIDHIKPISAFIAEGVVVPSEINSLDNLRPLWAIDNIIKGSRY